ncbi:MAG: DUF6265 family protein [Acidobacteriota bacterium]|nr:DUF6265 family protein [Acidobacteriota bacterium]
MRPFLRLLVLSMVFLMALGAGPAGSEKPTLESLEWLAGHWSIERGGTTMEEYWTPPAGGVMLGLHRDVFPNGRSFFEYLRIEEGPDGLVYKASPAGRPPTSFPLVALEGRRAVFENPDHDFPQRIIYEAGEDGALHARIEGVQNGKEASTDWTWHRKPCGSRE